MGNEGEAEVEDIKCDEEIGRGRDQRQGERDRDRKREAKRDDVESGARGKQHSLS